VTDRHGAARAVQPRQIGEEIVLKGIDVRHRAATRAFGRAEHIRTAAEQADRGRTEAKESHFT